MKKRMVIIGLVLLVIGIAFVAGGAAALRGTTSTLSTFTQSQTGEYVSSEVVLNSTSTVVIRSPSSTGGLITAQSLSEVNPTSLATYALPTNSTAGGSATYVGLKAGDYYYVIFTSSQPTTKIVIAENLAKTIESGILVLLGGVLFLAGLIVAIIGAIRKDDKPKQSSGLTDADYYSKRQDSPPPPPSTTVLQT